ncbi:condensation domain protein [Segniliparus rotundus DSM 44985]|uniref:Phthiocerol/phthiodiolone dimycocerosyl transferase n=2 Tax=Segniliparus rotundus TaxID=286802 RepID=D6ZCF3_SEGRD|nr:condensation domain protein [Segniliparus rotundus DSM 44985]
MESFMAGMSVTMNAIIRGRGRGRLEEPLLRQALALLREAHPALGGRVVRATGGAGFALRLDEPDLPVLRFVSADPEQRPEDEELLLREGEVLAVRVTTRGDRFRLVFSCHHSLADGRAMLAHLRRLLSIYTSLAATGKALAGPARPVPLSPEKALCERGVEKLDFEEFLRRGYGEQAVEFFNSARRPPQTPGPAGPVAAAAPGELTVARGRLRLSKEKTAALLRLGKRAQLTMHGLVSAAAVLAELLLEGAPDFLVFQLRSVVDARARVVPPITEPTAVTNFAGSSTAVVLAERSGDPLDWAKQVLSQIGADLESGLVAQSILQMSGSMDAVRELAGAACAPAPDTVFITNVGVLPPFELPDSIVLEDLHGVIHSSPGPDAFACKAGQGASRNRSYLVSTFNGRLNLDLFGFGADEARAAPLLDALERAFDTILARA